jgi:hypothetical protein
MRRTALLTAVVLVVGALAAPASAASVHLKGGKNAEPSFFDGGLTLSASGAIAGLGNGDVLVTLVATADVTSTCINPGTGEHLPPGQNPAPITVKGSQAIPEEEFKNGFTRGGAGLPEPPLDRNHRRPGVHKRHHHGGAAGGHDGADSHLHLQPADLGRAGTGQHS